MPNTTTSTAYFKIQTDYHTITNKPVTKTVCTLFFVLFATNNNSISGRLIIHVQLRQRYNEIISSDPI